LGDLALHTGPPAERERIENLPIVRLVGEIGRFRSIAEENLPISAADPSYGRF
jgi:hypothetical protein